MKNKSNYSLLLITFVYGSVLPQDLPGENDTFEDIRTKNRVYVDKTSYITELLQSEDRFFSMCRPGRFGKTNFLGMLRSFFAGRKELFAGLGIDEKHDWRITYPVIYLDFSSMNCSTSDAFEADLRREILDIGRTFGIELEEESPKTKKSRNKSTDYRDEFIYRRHEKLLFELIHHLAANGTRNESVVLLIDEYDWPVRPHYGRAYGMYHTLFDFRRVKEFQYYLNYYFFNELIEQKRYIKLLFCTCTSQMHYMNQGFPFELKDITFNSRFDSMMGLTGEELESDLKSHVNAMVGNTPNETFQTVVQQLRRRYNGYCFRPKSADTSPRLYNFHSVLSSLRDKNADYFWHPAADPKYEIIDDYSIHEIEEFANSAFRGSILGTASINVSRDTLLKSCACYEKLPVDVLMIIRGYLTFRGYNETSQVYTVAFPNEEMRESYRRAVLKIIRGGQDLPSENFVRECKNLTQRMMRARRNASCLVAQLNALIFERKDETRAADWQQRHSSDRVAAFVRTCDFSLRENLPREYDDSVRVEFSEKEYKDDYYMTDGEQRYVGLKILMSNRSEYWIHFEFKRSAPCALNVLLKKVSGRADWPKERTLYLMGINFRTKNDAIEEWIRITYLDGKFTDVQASHPNYLKMYAHVTNTSASSPIS